MFAIGRFLKIGRNRIFRKIENSGLIFGLTRNTVDTLQIFPRLDIKPGQITQEEIEVQGVPFGLWVKFKLLSIGLKYKTSFWPEKFCFILKRQKNSMEAVWPCCINAKDRQFWGSAPP